MCQSPCILPCNNTTFPSILIAPSMASFTKNISKHETSPTPPHDFQDQSRNLGHPDGCNSLVWSFNCLPIAVMQRLSGIHQLGRPSAEILYKTRFGISRMTFSNGFGWVCLNLYYYVGVRWLSSPPNNDARPFFRGDWILREDLLKNIPKSCWLVTRHLHPEWGRPTFQQPRHEKNQVISHQTKMGWFWIFRFLPGCKVGIGSINNEFMNHYLCNVHN